MSILANRSSVEHQAVLDKIQAANPGIPLKETLLKATDGQDFFSRVNNQCKIILITNIIIVERAKQLTKDQIEELKQQ